MGQLTMGASADAVRISLSAFVPIFFLSLRPLVRLKKETKHKRPIPKCCDFILFRMCVCVVEMHRQKAAEHQAKYKTLIRLNSHSGFSSIVPLHPSNFRLCGKLRMRCVFNIYIVYCVAWQNNVALYQIFIHGMSWLSFSLVNVVVKVSVGGTKCAIRYHINIIYIGFFLYKSFEMKSKKKPTAVSWNMMK